MRKPNAISDFALQRGEVLLANFREAIASESKISVEKAFRRTAEAPAPRFWVSEHRAAAVIGHILAGDDPLTGMYEEKREMYREIYERFLELRALRPHETIYALVSEVVNSPAPRSYLSPQRAKSIIQSEKRKRKLECRI